MPLRVGTIVKRYDFHETDDYSCSGYFPCERYNTQFPDVPVKLNVCVGMILEFNETGISDHPDVIVQWLTTCAYHRKYNLPAQTIDNIDYLWEVGQLT